MVELRDERYFHSSRGGSLPCSLIARPKELVEG